MKFFKGISAILSSALILSSMNLVKAETTSSSVPPNLLEKAKEVLNQNVEKLDKLSNTSSFQPNDTVRVIVETTGQTPLEYATEKGVLYKELPSTTKKTLKSKALTEQKTLKDKLKQQNVTIQYKKEFTTAFKGFSGNVKFKDIEKIKKTAGVKDVYISNEYNRPEPNMTTSHEFIQSYQTWGDAGFKGQGMVVAVIDTGVDPSHKDFVLSSDTNEKLSKSKVDEVVAANGLKGKFYTEKVPYGYNYFDQNNTILDLGPEASEHGMHVAGTVAANGGEDGVKGVAPEAQVLGMKVFSNDPNFPSTYSDIYLAAIDDSIALGADVLNMSLGSTAAFYDRKSAEDVAISRAVKNGIVCAVSAGNSGYSSSGYDLPFYNNPDIGVVGSPGLNSDTIQVAASGNTFHLYKHTLEYGDLKVTGYGVDSWKSLPNPKVVSLSETSLGLKEDYKGKDVKGKVVLVKRGSITFYEKAMNALAAGAAGIIVVDHGLSSFFDDQGGWGIPFMMVSKSNGESLYKLVKEQELTFTAKEESRSLGDDVGKITDFSSWGTTPSLELKPELTAPGGKIYSTLQNNKYGSMSGTSMAAPHVAGGSALVQQYLKNDSRFSSMKIKDRTLLAKTLLMNTAEVIENSNGQPYSPRQQGAGMMQTFAAVSTPVYAVNATNNKPKFELGEFKGSTITFNLKTVNLSNKAATYKVDTTVLTDAFLEKAGTMYNNLSSLQIKGLTINSPATVKVPANGIKTFSISVNLQDAKVQGYDSNGNLKEMPLQKNSFVEGYIMLKDNKTNGSNPALSLPFIGFFGEWDEPAIVDGLKGESTDYFKGSKYYGPGFTDILAPDGDDASFVNPVTYQGQTVYPFSPNKDGLNDSLFPYLSFLRNAREVQYNILDSNNKFLRRVQIEQDVRKNFTDAGTELPFTYNSTTAWDGTTSFKTVSDGLYYYEIKSIVDYAKSSYQSKKIPVLVDTVAPEITLGYDPKTKAITWTSSDALSGVAGYMVYVEDKVVASLPANATSFPLPKDVAGKMITVLTYDAAYNLNGATMTIEQNAPVINLDSNAPVALAVYNTKEIKVSGHVKEDTQLNSLKANETSIPFTYNSEKEQYVFSSTISVEGDGKQIVKFYADDIFGNVTEFARHFYVDTTLPAVNVAVKSRVGAAKESVVATFTLTDNLGYVDFYVNDNNEYKSKLDETTITTATNKTLKVTLNLELGTNTFSAILRDAAGNEIVKEFTVVRGK